MNNVYQRSRLAPTNLVIKDNYYILGEKYIRNLLVVGLPEEFGLGLLSLYCSNQNVKLFMTTEPHKANIQKALKKELKEKRNLIKKTNEDVVITRLNLEIESLQNYIYELAHSRDKSVNMMMVYSVSANSLKDLDSETLDLKQMLETDGFKTITVSTIQVELMKNTTPMFSDDEIPTVIKENYGVVTPATSVAGLFPYTFQTLKDPSGFLYGRELNQAGIVNWNPFLYTTHNSLAKQTGRLNNNVVILGQSGSGKSTDLGLIIRYAIREKMKIVWIDPENKNYYLTKKFAGSYINWGTRDYRINMFDLKPIDSEDGDDVNMYDTELAIYNVVHLVKTVIKLYKSEISEDMLDMIDSLVIETYKEKGITFNKSFKELSYSDYPILSEFLGVIEKRIESIKNDVSYQVEYDLLRKLVMKLTTMTTTDRFFFDGHTTIDTSGASNMLSFGCKTFAEKSSGLSDAMIYLMFRHAWSKCLDNNEPSIFIVDEAHQFLLKGNSAEELATFYRRSRKYNNSSIIASQEPEDLTSDVLVNGVAVSVHSKAIFNNSCYKVIKALEKNAVESLGTLVTLNDNEKERIENFGMGDSLFMYGRDRMLTFTLATQKEIAELESLSK
ncbi:VirB4 family type IV secretion system protein [Erysipelothrix rhusiopathiae]|uniref:VirB4 family type IV secretion system protein n=1 Tax=Erysipelothrix rhusiopathiae TaxID=1648 RepID=UPI003BF50F7C